jgi:hypothetical protein
MVNQAMATHTPIMKMLQPMTTMASGSLRSNASKNSFISPVRNADSCDE